MARGSARARSLKRAAGCCCSLLLLQSAQAFVVGPVVAPALSVSVRGGRDPALASSAMHSATARSTAWRESSSSSSSTRRRRLSPLLMSTEELSEEEQEQALLAALDEGDEDDVEMEYVNIQPKALEHLIHLKETAGEGKEILLRMGVRSGGCSGMSYVMDLIKQEEVDEDDILQEYPDHGFKCVIDPKSLLYLFGLELDYSDALVGGGFQFQNPQATSSCGCGKSFGI